MLPYNLSSIYNKPNDDYYDLTTNRVFVRGIKHSDDVMCFKMIKNLGVPRDIYAISEIGTVYSIINDCSISWSFRNNLPYVNLSVITDRGWTMEPFYIKNLVAYNYIANADNYLERGCHASYIDGDPMNCNYRNIIYLEGSKDYINNSTKN